MIMAFPRITEATVYGVAVPGTEGAAGMAALVVDGALDLGQLRAHLARRLPSYARPLFLRLSDRIDITATFKHRKLELAGSAEALGQQDQDHDGCDRQRTHERAAHREFALHIELTSWSARLPTQRSRENHRARLTARPLAPRVRRDPALDTKPAGSPAGFVHGAARAPRPRGGCCGIR